MQVCTSLQTDNQASTPSLSFLQAGCPSCHPTNSVKALKETERVVSKGKHVSMGHWPIIFSIYNYVLITHYTKQQNTIITINSHHEKVYTKKTVKNILKLNQ